MRLYIGVSKRLWVCSSRFLTTMILVFFLTGCAYYHARSPAHRISYEEKVGREFAVEASGVLRLTDEPEILDFVKTLGHQIADELVGSQTQYRFYVVREPVMNAFAVPGGYIYLFAGLIANVDSEDELAGIMSHEIGHVEGNHFIRGQKKLDITNIAVIAATILAATLGGGEHAAAIGTLAQAAQISTALHYSREFEREADRSSIRLSHKAGYQPEGITSMFDKFQAQARLNASDLPPYFSTHPLPTDRIYEVESWIRAIRLPPPEKKLLKGFALARLTARIRTENDDKILSELQEDLRKNPKSAHAQFLLGYFHLKRGDLKPAKKYLGKAFEMNPSVNDYALYLARTFQLSGQVEQAESLLSRVLRREPENSLALVFFGDLKAQVNDWDSALFHYRKAITLAPDSSFAHLSLGMAYGRHNQIGMSYYQLGLADKCAGRFIKAQHYFKKALKHLPPKSKEAVSTKVEISRIE